MDSAKDELAKLQNIYDAGFIFEEEYNRRKQEILDRYGITDDSSANSNTTEAPTTPTYEQPTYYQPPETTYTYTPPTYDNQTTETYTPYSYGYDAPTTYQQPEPTTTYEQPTYYQPTEPTYTPYTPVEDSYAPPTSYNTTSTYETPTTPKDVVQGVKTAQDVERIHRIEPKVEKNTTGQRETYVVPVPDNSVVVVLKTKGGVYQSEPLQNPTKKTISDLFNQRRGFLEKVLTASNIKHNSKSDEVLAPGIYRLKENSTESSAIPLHNEESASPWDPAYDSWKSRQYSTLSDLLQFPTNTTNGYQPLTAFRGMPSKPDEPYKVSDRVFSGKIEISERNERECVKVHFCIRIRMLAARHGVAEKRYFDALIERNGKCFVCGQPSSDGIFCDAHTDDMAIKMFNELKQRNQVPLERRPLTEEESQIVFYSKEARIITDPRLESYPADKEKVCYIPPNSVARKVTSSSYSYYSYSDPDCPTWPSVYDLQAELLKNLYRQ